MAKRKRRLKTSHKDPVLSRGIISILLVVLSILITLSFFGKASTVGVVINDYVLSFLFGDIRYSVPLIILIIVWFLIKDIEYEYRVTHFIGAGLFFLAASGLMHVGFDMPDMWQQSLDGHGGGIFGMAAWPLKTYVGQIASIVIFIGLILVSVLLMFNTAITHFILLHKKFFSALGFLGRSLVDLVKTLFVLKKSVSSDSEYGEDDDYEDEEEDEEDVGKSKKRRFFSKDLEDEEEEEEFESEKDEEEIKDSETSVDSEETVNKDSKVDPKKKTSSELIEQVLYLQNVVIKKIPSISLLTSKKGKPTSGDIKENARIIADTFKEFKIDVEVKDVRVGPSVTQYSVKPSRGIKLSRMTGLSNNLSLNLAAHPIRIEAPIPGKSLVGIEVPNEKVAQVTLKELLLSKEFKRRPHNIMLALGKDVGAKSWFLDLTRLPHLLIAGATGSGKTVCINTILLSLLYQNTAETLRLILVDPKRVELTHYEGIPHLLTPVITDVHKTVNAIKWTIGEMERRFEILAQSGNRDIDSYNAKHPNNKIPQIIFVIDELADLMVTAANQVEPGIIRLAQMARAVGIHLILATQRPSVDVITGLMKANIPGRIAFSVASLVDSRTILDMSGAEKLLGRGDMLILTAELSKPVRVQGAFVSEDELQAVTQYLRSGKEAKYDESVVEKSGAGTLNLFGGPTDDQDPLYDDAMKAILDAGKASASFLQRKLKIGYARAARILDELEENRIIGSSDGAKPREILVTETEYDLGMDMGGKLNVYDDEIEEEEDENDEEEIEEEEIEDEDEDEEENEDEEEFDEEDLGEDEDEKRY